MENKLSRNEKAMICFQFRISRDDISFQVSQQSPLSFRVIQKSVLVRETCAKDTWDKIWNSFN